MVARVEPYQSCVSQLPLDSTLNAVRPLCIFSQSEKQPSDRSRNKRRMLCGGSATLVMAIADLQVLLLHLLLHKIRLAAVETLHTRRTSQTCSATTATAQPLDCRLWTAGWGFIQLAIPVQHEQLGKGKFHTTPADCTTVPYPAADPLTCIPTRTNG